MKILFIDPMGEFEMCSLLAAFKDMDSGFDFEKSAKKICKDAHVSFANAQRMCMQMPLCAVTTPQDDAKICYDELIDMAEGTIADAELLASVKKMWQILNRGFADAKKDFEITVGAATNAMCTYACIHQWLQSKKIDYIVCLPIDYNIDDTKCMDIAPSPVTQKIFVKQGFASSSFTNPTDAAAICALANEFDSMPEMDITQTGYGAQSKGTDDGKVTRAVVGNQHGNFFFEFATEQIFELANTMHSRI